MKQKLFFLLVTLCMPLAAFKIDRVILATDNNPLYIEFWPIVAQAWKERIGVQPTLALIASSDVCVDESLGDVIRFEPLPGIPTSLQAQTIRLLLPAYFPDEVCIISDIDMIPLSKEYFVDSVAGIPDDAFVSYREVADIPKYPMCYVAAKGSVFKEIFQISSVHDIGPIIAHWHSLNIGWQTDEMALYYHLLQWPKQENKFIKLRHRVGRRIDRYCWGYDDQSLEQGYYIDAHCPRPYSAYKYQIDAVLKKAKYKIKPRPAGNVSVGTHMAALTAAVINTDGPVLEMGSGDYSTPLLHALCAKNKRFLLTTDTDKKWLNYFRDLENDWHSFEYVPVYEDDWMVNPKPALWDNVAKDMHWSVVLIDHRPGERRIEDIKRLRKNADIFVVHDTEEPSYGYGPILSTFKYVYIDVRYTTQTTVVSDTIDITQFFK